MSRRTSANETRRANRDQERLDRLDARLEIVDSLPHQLFAGKARRAHRLGLGGLLLDLLHLVALLALLGLLAAVLRGRLLLLPATAVVGRIETRALEVHGYWVENDLDRPLSADLARFGRRVAHALEALEQVALRAPVLVDRHGCLR